MLCQGTNVDGVKITKLIRLGGRGQNQNVKPRLIMATLDQPARRRVILAAVKTLRYTDKWSNVYVSPDLAPAEREKEKKLREELKTRRSAGEMNIIIRGSQIITKVGWDSRTTHEASVTTNETEIKSDTGATQMIKTPTKQQ